MYISTQYNQYIIMYPCQIPCLRYTAVGSRFLYGLFTPIFRLRYQSRLYSSITLTCMHHHNILRCFKMYMTFRLCKIHYIVFFVEIGLLKIKKKDFPYKRGIVDLNFRFCVLVIHIYERCDHLPSTLS